MNEPITPVGKVDHRDDHRVFGLKRKDRRYHLVAIGRTGSGESALLSKLIKAGLEQGEGLAVRDPHGDLADAARRSVPAWRTDTIYFGPGKDESSLTFKVGGFLRSGNRDSLSDRPLRAWIICYNNVSLSDLSIPSAANVVWSMRKLKIVPPNLKLRFDPNSGIAAHGLRRS